MYRIAFSISSFLVFSAYAGEVYAEGACPPGADPAYCTIANATGGTVYSPAPGETNEQMLNRFVHDEKTRIQQKEVEAQRAYELAKPRPANSRDIGCGDIGDERTRVICEATSASMKYQLFGGHGGGIESAYLVTGDTVKTVFCEQHVTEADMSGLKASLQPLQGRKPIDFRWDSAVKEYGAMLGNKTPCDNG